MGGCIPCYSRTKAFQDCVDLCYLFYIGSSCPRLLGLLLDITVSLCGSASIEGYAMLSGVFCFPKQPFYNFRVLVLIIVLFFSIQTQALFQLVHHSDMNPCGHLILPFRPLSVVVGSFERVLSPGRLRVFRQSLDFGIGYLW